MSENERLDVFEVILRCENKNCGLTVTETTTDLFHTLHQRGCGNCGCGIIKVLRCKHIFGDPIPKPEDFFERRPDKEPEE